MVVVVVGVAVGGGGGGVGGGRGGGGGGGVGVDSHLRTHNVVLVSGVGTVHAHHVRVLHT